MNISDFIPLILGFYFVRIFRGIVDKEEPVEFLAKVGIGDTLIFILMLLGKLFAYFTHPLIALNTTKGLVWIFLSDWFGA